MSRKSVYVRNVVCCLRKIRLQRNSLSTGIRIFPNLNLILRTTCWMSRKNIRSEVQNSDFLLVMPLEMTLILSSRWVRHPVII